MGLIISANRSPVRKTSSGLQPTIGGLTTALLPVLERMGGVWVATEEGETIYPYYLAFPPENPRFQVRMIPISEAQYNNYYYGFANKVIWPLAHGLPQYMELCGSFYTDYQCVNACIAQAMLAEWKEGDYFWIQDYHQMLVPSFIRQKKPSSRIGFFWHISWPSVDMFQIIPQIKELVCGLLDADLIGFSSEEYSENFLNTVRVLLKSEVGRNYVIWKDRQVRVETHPIGIDTNLFRDYAASTEVCEKSQLLRNYAHTEFVALGVDRLDYTKGVLERLLGFEHFLQSHPQYHKRITLYQILSPSRTQIHFYSDYKRKVEEVIGRINGAFMQEEWIPVRYFYKCFSQKELASFYQAADLALVTPLRDGMNLVAQEFVSITEKGVLILSNLCGASQYLPEALLVHPDDVEAIASKIKLSIEMNLEEKQTRIMALKRQINILDVHNWSDKFLTSLSYETTYSTETSNSTRLRRNSSPFSAESCLSSSSS